MNIKFDVDGSKLYAELIKIQALLWAMSEFNIPEGEQWNKFNDLYDSWVERLQKEFGASQKDQK